VIAVHVGDKNAGELANFQVTPQEFDAVFLRHSQITTVLPVEADARRTLETLRDRVGTPELVPKNVICT
jgi:hypothetical protein